MTAAFRVVSPGLGASLQDSGRFGFRRSGVPVSGPMDRVAFGLANALAVNAPDTTALELLMFGPTLEVVADSLRVAVVGSVTLQITTANGDVARPANQSFRLERGDVLKVGALDPVLCGYLALEGGFVVPKVLGSMATYMRSALGGIDGRVLRQGDVLHGSLANAELRSERALAREIAPAFDQPIRVVKGPQDDYFSDAAMETFLSQTYTVSPQSDRMGFRLEGPALEHVKGYNIVSDGIVCGSIQVPGDGKPIVLMADSQTAGGYPKIATVISADIPVLARRKPGRSVRFAAVSRDEAEAIRRQQETDTQKVIAEMRDVKAEAAIDLDALQDANLIGGVVNAFE